MSEAIYSSEVRQPEPPRVALSAQDQDRKIVWELPEIFRPADVRPGLEQIVILAYDRNAGEWRIAYDATRLAARLEDLGVDRALSYQLVRLAWGRYVGELRTWIEGWERRLPSRGATAKDLERTGDCLIVGSEP